MATGGTLALVLWSAAVTFLAGLGLLLFRAPLEPSLLTMGAVLAFTAWWGPGGRRVRRPTRGLLLRATRSPVVGWLAVGVMAVAAAGVGYLLLSRNGVTLGARSPGPAVAARDPPRRPGPAPVSGPDAGRPACRAHRA